jgi:prepilin-type N-terminal cleavage/methylation domain-containing protein/prepilin-type processing-associated H-X9-DG protein
MSNRATDTSNGLTLIETLIAIAITGILIALLLGGIQAAREAGRRAGCVNNLRQLGIALTSYESAYQQFPPWVVANVAAPNQHFEYSVFARVLPGLDQTPLFNGLNFSAQIGAAVAVDSTHANYTVAVTRLQVLICPSDTVPSPAPASYRMDQGRAPFWYKPTVLAGNDPQAPFYVAGGRRASQITDGLSNTSFLSERVFGDGATATFDVQRDVIPANPSALGALAYDRPYWTVCQASESWPVAIVDHFSQSGWQWLTQSTLLLGFSHAMTPNQRVVDCNQDVNPSSLGGAVAARSFHPGGVNVLLGDGAVRFATDGINPAVWQALSTIAAGDNLGSGF